MDRAPAARLVVAALLVSGLGHVVHNLAEFPVAILLGWETLFPIAVSAVLGLAWYSFPGRVTFAAMVGWAAIVLLGGGGSVIPFGFLPFVPEQSLAHYAAHLVYAGTQLPLIWVGIQGFRSGGRTAASASSDRTIP